MPKSLFDNTEPNPPSEEKIKKIHQIKEKSNIPLLLPDNIDTNPYSDNPPQVFIDGKKIPEGVQASGSFFLRGEDMFADIRIEFNVKNSKYSEYHKRLKDLVNDANKDGVLLSSSGI